MADGRRAVAVALGVGIGEHLVDSSGRKFADVTVRAQANVDGRETKRPLVVAVDSNGALRESMKAYLQGEGYDVMALNNGLDAREILDMLAPALIVAEIEGEDMPGYDLCAHVKATRSLRHIPVVLTTSSAYPSDYSNAHKMGAVVCMAKPFKLDRLGHVARLLAPVPNAKCDPAAAQRKADPSRKACSAPHHGAGRAAQSKKVYDESTAPRRKLRFPSFR
jgi:CheY-like chemotaxis protein